MTAGTAEAPATCRAFLKPRAVTPATHIHVRRANATYQQQARYVRLGNR
jgi:hypothetical protein